MTPLPKCAAMLLFPLLTAPVFADVRLHGLFNDNMVLQQGLTVPVWGHADPGETVFVRFFGQMKTAVADADGRWMVRLDPLEYTKGHESLDMTISASNTIVVKNVLVGEVWLCSGQSNMGRRVNTTTTGPATGKRAANRLLRLCRVSGLRTNETNSPRREIGTSNWLVAAPDCVLNFSAAAYYFGRELQDDLCVPIGVIDSSYGGSAMLEWVPLNVIRNNPAFSDALLRMQKSLDDLATYQRLVVEYKETRARAKAESRELNDEEKKPPRIPKNVHSRFARHYNCKLAPLIPYAIKGVLWYQGESDAGRYMTYQEQLESLIASWRRNWGQGDFPFLIVELPPFVERSGHYYPKVWEAQQKTLRIPNTGLVNGFQVGSFFDIHPPNKEPLGPHTSLAAQKIAYGRNVVACGPTYHSQRIEGDKIVLSFDNVGGGLVARNGTELVGFMVAGKDGRFVPAHAVLVGSKVVVSSPKVREPAIVRYEGSVDGNTFEVFFEELVRDETTLTLDLDRISGEIADDAVFQVANAWGHYYEPKVVEIKDGTVVITPDQKNREANDPTTLCYSRKVDGKMVTTTFSVMEVFDGKCMMAHDRVPGERLTTIMQDGRLAGFAIAGPDELFVEADARIVGDTVVVSSPEIKHPVAVRYCWYSLFNRMRVEDGKCVIRDCSRVRIGGFAEAVKMGDLDGFTVAGADGTFYDATVESMEFSDDGAGVGKKRQGLVVSSTMVAEPVTMRWKGKGNTFKVWALPPFSLFNKENLPTSGFRTDEFRL